MTVWCKTFASAAITLILVLATWLGFQSAALSVPSSVLGPQAVLLPPVSPEAAEAMIAKRADLKGQNRGILTAPSSKAANRTAIAAPSAPIPASVAELARALKYDPVQIYEFVCNNIEIVPMWGVLKGSTATLDPSGLNYTTSYGYDGYGNRTTVKGPRSDVDDTVTTAFDAGRNPTTITGPNPGSGPPVTQLTYDGNNRVTSIARKRGANWMVSCTAYTASGQVSASYGAWKTGSPADCSFSGNTVVPYTSYGYDGADRLNSTNIAEPSGNRITNLALYPDGLIATVVKAAGTPVAATETTAYSNNGLPASVTDARGNITGMSYDGFDRLTLLQYPPVTGGGPSSTDLVAFAYDNANRLTSATQYGRTVAYSYGPPSQGLARTLNRAA